MKIKSITKKLIAVCMLLVMVFSMTGCGMAMAGKINEDYNSSTLTNTEKIKDKNIALIFFNNGAYSRQPAKPDDITLTTVDLSSGFIIMDDFQISPKSSNDLGLNAKSSLSGIFRGVAAMMLNATLAGKEVKTAIPGNPTGPRFPILEEAYDGGSGSSGDTEYSISYEDAYAITGSWTSDLFDSIQLDPISIIKKVNESTSEALKEDSDTYKTLGNVISLLQGCAAAILIAIWAMGFISQIVNEKFSMETLIKTLMQLLCGIVLIKEGPTLVRAFVTTGNLLVDEVTAQSQVVMPAFRDELIGMLDNPLTINSVHLNFFDSRTGFVFWFDFAPLGVILYLAIPFIALVLCAYKIISRMIMRMLELIVRITMAPIPLAFSAQNGFSQESIRYLRATFACALEPILMILGAACSTAVCKIICEIFGSDINTIKGILPVFALSITYFVLNAYMGETKHMAQEVIAR